MTRIAEANLYIKQRLRETVNDSLGLETLRSSSEV